MKGSKALLKMLEDRGVSSVFGYPGATVIPIYDEFLESNVRHILVRHEQCAAHMADGYARATGTPGVCLATSGPGTTNLVTGIATAYADSVPMIALTGQVGTNFLGAEAFQEVDSYSLMMPVTKHNFRVLDPERLPHAINEGWKICQSGRPGPVHIDMPVDQINSDIDEDLLTKEWGVKEPATDVSRINDAALLIKNSARPVLLIGGGAINASEEIVRLAEFANIPVITTLMSLGIVPSGHPLNMGPLGMHGRMGALDLFHDFIISDYYVAKSLIFSRNNLQEDEYQLFARFFNIIFSDMPKPELMVYLYSDVARLQRNIRKRGRSYEQEISDAYLENIQQGYFDFLRQQQNNMRILLIDTNRLDFVANEHDYQRIIEVIDQPYEIGLHRVSL
jgi:hypothetical protein